MDKQLLEEFNIKYFGKNQLKRRIYEENELEIIWKNISGNRKKTSVNINKNNFWYNITGDVKMAITYINDTEKGEITNYIVENRNSKSYVESSNEKLLGVSSIEELYVDKYSDDINMSIYRCKNDDELMNGYEIKSYELKDSENSSELLVKLLEFIENDKTYDIIIKSAILHFNIIYLSPFISNNLDMAEHITSRYLIKNGYKIIRYCNILDLIKVDERRYYKALENSLINEGDITYFVKYYVGIIQIAIKELTKDITIKNGKKIIKELIENSDISLEERQIKFINSMLVSNINKISIDDYKKKSKISYETARSDLNVLVAIGFFKISKAGKKYEYYFNDISTIIDSFNDMSVI